MDAPAPAPSDRILERLKALHPKLIDLTLDRVERLLADLGNPHHRLPPVIHVAGTNGKGSVVAYARAALEAAGATVHVYTSPHLVRFHERIRLAGQLIEEDALVRLLDEVEAVNGGRPITFFEVTTAAAFLAYARAPADWLVLEVGLGGRLDATNVIEHPAATVITPVSLDHQQFLGETIAAIAGEKAGILRPGAPAIIGPQDDEARAVIAARIAAVGARGVWFGRDFDATLEGGRLRFRDGATTLDLPPPALPGAHQIGNAATALATLRRLPGMAVDGAALARGLTAVEWPARLQRLYRGDLRDRLPADRELWLDGGHNAAAGVMLADHAARHWADRPLDLVVGMMSSKDAGRFLAPLGRVARRVIAVPIPGEAGAFAPEDVARLGAAHGVTVATAPSTAAALARLAAPAGAARVLICGSLYLAGTVLAENG
jgi:dihydrofolate synthase/folylpolyglutamate synthase